MSDLRKWFTGTEVLQQLAISRLDLFELIEDGKITAYNERGMSVQITREELDGFAGFPVKRIPGGYTFVKVG